MGDVANLSFSIHPMSDNIHFAWNGFNDSIPTFVIETIKRMDSMKDQDLSAIFDLVKEEALEDCANFYLDQSYMQSMGTFKAIISDVEPQKKEVRELLEGYDYAQF